MLREAFRVGSIAWTYLPKDVLRSNDSTYQRDDCPLNDRRGTEATVSVPNVVNAAAQVDRRDRELPAEAAVETERASVTITV